MIGRRELMGAMAAGAVASLASPPAHAKAPAGKGFRVGQGARWIAIGDSITDAGRAKPIGEGTNGLGTALDATRFATIDPPNVPVSQRWRRRRVVSIVAVTTPRAWPITTHVPSTPCASGLMAARETSFI